MAALAYHSDRAAVAALVTRHTHSTSHKPARTKPEQRRRKSDRRDFRIEIASCLYGYLRTGVEL